MPYLNVRLPIIANKTENKKLLVNNLLKKKAFNLVQASINLLGFLHILGLYVFGDRVFTGEEGKMFIVKSTVDNMVIKIKIKFSVIIIFLIN